MIHPGMNLRQTREWRLYDLGEGSRSGKSESGDQFWGDPALQEIVKASHIYGMIILSVGGVFMFCLNCAKQIGDITKNRICPYCGYEQYRLG